MKVSGLFGVTVCFDPFNVGTLPVVLPEQSTTTTSKLNANDAS